MICEGAFERKNGSVGIRCTDCNKIARYDDVYVDEYGGPCDIEPSYRYVHLPGKGCKKVAS